MNVFERLTQHYQTQPPRLSFGGSEGSAMQMRVFAEDLTFSSVDHLWTTDIQKRAINHNTSR